jgi:hypothetical protein
MGFSYPFSCPSPSWWPSALCTCRRLGRSCGNTWGRQSAYQFLNYGTGPQPPMKVCNHQVFTIPTKQDITIANKKYCDDWDIPKEGYDSFFPCIWIKGLHFHLILGKLYSWLWKFLVVNQCLETNFTFASHWLY